LVVNGDIWTDYIFDIDFKLREDMLAKIILVDNPPHNPDGDFYVSKLIAASTNQAGIVVD